MFLLPRLSILLVGVLALAGCDCGGNTVPDTDAGMTADVPGLDAPGSEGGTCASAGSSCSTSADCCLGLSCDDVGGSRICAATCAAEGASCVLPADCCSLDCRGGVCMTGGACAVLGDACTDDTDCCSLTCGAGGTCADNPASSCNPLGEACTSGATCCSGRCADDTGAACTGGDCRCEGAAACRAAGDLCTTDAQCCIGLCDRPGGAAVGVCAASGACGVAGQPCGTEGFNGSCCSTACLDVLGTGTPTCQPLGGCRVQNEPCRGDADCCSGSCTESGTGTDGRPVMRCANTGSCQPAGEVCGGAGATMNCCPDGGGGTGCEPSSTGVSRCLGGTGSCTLPGAECTMTSECCVETYPDITCAPGRGGANVCCLPDGAECDFGDTCCGGICVPDATGTLRCGATCIADAMPCTTDSDCCGCACVPDGAGGSVCTSDPDVCSPCTGAPLGGNCTADADCCNNPTVVCNEETGVEFPTCVLAP